MKENLSRREILRSLGRFAALTGLAGIGGMVGYRQQYSQPDPACKITDPCQTCRVFDHCALPQALSARRIDKEPIRG